MTREEALESARESSQKAKDLLYKLNAVLAECEKEYPCGTFDLTKAQIKKNKTPNEIFARVERHARKLERVQNEHTYADRCEKERSEKLAEVAKAKEKEAQLSKLRGEAIVFCLKHGESFDDGLTVDNAISTANSIAFDLKVAETELEIGEGHIKFSGQNCYDPCDGWNPSEKRCQCGNRRVGWVALYGFDDFKDTEIQAQAG